MRISSVPKRFIVGYQPRVVAPCGQVTWQSLPDLAARSYEMRRAIVMADRLEQRAAA